MQTAHQLVYELLRCCTKVNGCPYSPTFLEEFFSETAYSWLSGISCTCPLPPSQQPDTLSLFFTSLLARRESLVDNRVLGAIAMICAPAMLGFLLGGEDNALITGIASMVFMAGWICSNVGMQRMRATGTGTWGRAVLLIQLVGLVLAFIFGFFEAMALLDENNIIFVVTDLAWPLSMLWMLVVGVTVIVAKRLSGWQRFVPVLCPF